MSRQPTKEEITALFKNIDKDNRGTISSDELYDALGRSNFKKEEVALLIADLDKDNSGKIDIKGIF